MYRNYILGLRDTITFVWVQWLHIFLELQTDTVVDSSAGITSWQTKTGQPGLGKRVMTESSFREQTMWEGQGRLLQIRLSRTELYPGSVENLSDSDRFQFCAVRAGILKLIQCTTKIVLEQQQRRTKRREVEKILQVVLEIVETWIVLNKQQQIPLFWIKKWSKGLRKLSVHFAALEGLSVKKGRLLVINWTISSCAAMQDPNWRLCKEVLATNVRQVLSTGQITFLHAHPGLQPPSTWQNKQQCSWDGALSVHVVGSWVAGSDPGQGPRYHFLYWKSAGGVGGQKNQIWDIDIYFDK